MIICFCKITFAKILEKCIAYDRKLSLPVFFESLSIINGVQPQINCNVCNTGDIHINGMDGAYTMILIDGIAYR